MKIMAYKNFKAQIMEASRLKGDRVYDLPSGNPLDVYYSDEFINYPENWMKGPGVFVVPVLPETGLWFNWTFNSDKNTAIVPTVKGCNPITGLKTSGFHLERYEDKCPKHGCSFIGDRFCEECGYKWPYQNYVAYPNVLWWDGYRSESGNVRQFFFTEELMRDVSSALIGTKNTVPAFGFAFYTPKEIREEHSRATIRSKGYTDPLHNVDCTDLYIYSSDLGLGTIEPLGTSAEQASPGNLGLGAIEPLRTYNCTFHNDSAEQENLSAFHSFSEGKLPTKSVSFHPLRSEIVKNEPEKKRIKATKVKEVSVGAGAKIKQDLISDPYPLDSWKSTPDATMTIYFVFHEKLEELKSKGMRDLKGHSEGILSKIPVG